MRAFGQPVLDGVVVDVIEVSLKVSLITDDVFPEPPLPDAPAAIAAARVADRALLPAAGDPRAGE